MRQVVTMGNIVARERPEAALEGHRLSWIQRDHVFFAGILRVRVGAADARKHRMLFLVHVHRMDPAATSIRGSPDLTITASAGEGKGRGGVEFKTIDDPLRFAARGPA